MKEYIRKMLMSEFTRGFVRGFVISFGMVMSAYLLAGLVKLVI